jgi:hypothetical protein
MASMDEIAATLRGVVRAGMTPKELRVAVRERHPDASKREIVRAAFYALTDVPASGEATLADLHTFALSERGQDDHAEADVKVGAKDRKRRGKKRHAKGTAENATH